MIGVRYGCYLAPTVWLKSKDRTAQKYSGKFQTAPDISQWRYQISQTSCLSETIFNVTPGIRIEKVKGSDLEESFTELLHFRREKSRVLHENKEELRQSAEKATAAHSRTLAWKIPWTEEPGGLQSVRWLELRYN